MSFSQNFSKHFCELFSKLFCIVTSNMFYTHTQLMYDGVYVLISMLVINSAEMYNKRPLSLSLSLSL